MPFLASPLSQENILRDVHDPVTQTLRTASSATIIAPGSIAVDIDHTSDSIRLGDGTNLLTSTQNAGKTGLDVALITPITIAGVATEVTLEEINSKIVVADTNNVTIVSSVLPTGAATEAKQDVANTSLSSLDGKLPAGLTVVANRLVVDNSQVTQPISAAFLPLPTGAATDANQLAQLDELVDINSNLVDVNNNLTELTNALPSSLGQKIKDDSLSVTIASDQGPFQVAGTEDGLSSGTQRGLVYTPRQQVLAALDRVDTYTYADFGTKDQRITQVDYTSATFPGITVRRVFNYILDGNRYRRTNSPWSII